MAGKKLTPSVGRKMERQRFNLPFKPTNQQIRDKALELVKKNMGTQVTDRDVLLLEKELRRKFGSNLPGKALQGKMFRRR
tara:strand:+ start:202 stop:441 length:240 start_codon:yes stop_codon:yes gene_type:complete